MTKKYPNMKDVGWDEYIERYKLQRYIDDIKEAKEMLKGEQMLMKTATQMKNGKHFTIKQLESRKLGELCPYISDTFWKNDKTRKQSLNNERKYTNGRIKGLKRIIRILEKE